MYEITNQLAWKGTVRPTSVPGEISRVNLDVIVALQSPVGIIYALDRSSQDLECGGVLIRRGWSGFQLSAPRVGKGERTVGRSRGIRDGFTE